MSNLFLALLSCALLMISTGANAKEGWPNCPANGRDIAFKLDVSMGQVKYSNRYNGDQIAQMHNTKKEHLGMTWQQAGLTSAEDSYSLNIGTRHYTLGQGRYCSVLSEMSLSIGYSKIDVFIDRKYGPGSCEYEAILGHENTHVSINRDVLRQYVPKIRQQLERYARSIGPIYSTSPDTTARRMQKVLGEQLQLLHKPMSSVRQARHARIDTRSNYLREQKRCVNW